MTTASSERIASATRRMDRHGRIEPQPLDRAGRRPGPRPPRPRRASSIRRAYSAQSVARSIVIGQTRPWHPSSARRPSTAARKSPRVLLHHREQQVAAGVAGERAVLEHRQAREQDLARLALVARERQRAPQHVARRQHAKLVAQLAGDPPLSNIVTTAFEVEPGIVLESAQQARQSGPAAETADLRSRRRTRLLYGRDCVTPHDRMRTDDASRASERPAARSTPRGGSAAHLRRPASSRSSRYGPRPSVGVRDDASTADDLDACATLVERVAPRRLAPPLVMTPDEFRRSLDAFPLEYQAILDRHVVIAGTRSVRRRHGRRRTTCGARARCRRAAC